MNVKALIKQLQSYPADMEVGFARFGGLDEYGDAHEVCISTVDKVHMKEVYFSGFHNEYLIADDEAFDRDEDVENRVILSYTE